MAYDQGDFDYDPGGGFGPYEAEVINAGVGVGKYGPEILLVCKPTNPKRGLQNLHMGIGKEGKFEFGGKQQVITTGKGEKAFDVTIFEEIVSGPKIKVITKGGLFLNALKHLGFKLQGGDMTAYIGLKLDLEEIKSPEAIRRFNEVHADNKLEAFGKDYDITIPTKIISKPAKKVSLKEAVLEVIKGKTEADMEAWYKGTDRYDGSVTPLYKLLAELEKTEVLIVDDKYIVKKETKA
jgi:hypothetical protein